MLSESHRGSYIRAHVLLNLLNESWKRDKMRGLPSILSLFRNEFIYEIIYLKPKVTLHFELLNISLLFLIRPN